MSAPGIVESALDDEDVVERVSLGGDDEAFVTPTRTLVYRADGLLSDESVEEYPHEAKRLSVSEGRRKTKIELEYVGGGNQSLTVPGDRLHAVLEPIVAGMLRTRSVTGEDESIAGAFRFSELTLVITDERLIKHIGEAVWDDTFESYEFGDVTALEYEEGSVATQIVLTVDGRKQRIKTPNDRTPDVREMLEEALLTYHGIDSVEDLAGPDGDDGDDGEEADEEDTVVEFDEGVDPLTTADDPGDSGDPDESGGAQVDEERTAATSAAPDGSTVGGGTATASAEADPTATDVAGSTATDADEATVSNGDEATATEASEAATETDAGTVGGDDSTGSDATDVGTGSGPGTDPVEQSGSDGGAGPGEGSVTESSRDSGTGGEAKDEGESSVPESDIATGADEDATGADDDVSEDIPFTETFEPIDEGIDPEVRSELEDVRAAIERQNELLARQQETIEELVAELRDRR